MDDRDEGGGDVKEDDGGVQTGGGDELSISERQRDDIRDDIRLR